MKYASPRSEENRSLLLQGIHLCRNISTIKLSSIAFDNLNVFWSKTIEISVLFLELLSLKCK